VASTIEAGRKVVDSDIDKLLSDGFQQVRQHADITNEEERRGRMLLAGAMEEGEPQQQTLGWGKVARDTERAMEKLCFVGQIHPRGH
jgi:hypothetical protein